MSSSTVTMSRPTDSSIRSVEAAQAELRMAWETHMENSQSIVRYRKVAVLMFYWDKSDLDTTKLLKQEVEELATVFQDEYKYEVRIKLLNHPKPQLLLQRIIIEFLMDYDAPDTLLIIYYAGHGWSKEGRLNLLRDYSQKSKGSESVKPNSVAWESAESLLTDRVADVLAIFDCCDSRSLCRSRGPVRFEVLASCCDNQTTAPPGDTSFTRALIWALRVLKTHENGKVTATVLQKQIKKYKDFPKAQFPHWHQREDDAWSNIVIAPMDSNYSTPEPQQAAASIERYVLDLRFQYHEPITEEVLKELADNLKHLISIRRIRAQRVGFVAARSAKEDTIHRTFQKWKNVTVLGRASRKQSQKQQMHLVVDVPTMPLSPGSEGEAHGSIISNASDVGNSVTLLSASPEEFESPTYPTLDADPAPSLHAKAHLKRPHDQDQDETSGSTSRKKKRKKRGSARKVNASGRSNSRPP